MIHTSFAVPQICYRKGNICESENFVVLLLQIIHASASISWFNETLAALIAPKISGKLHGYEMGQCGNYASFVVHTMFSYGRIVLLASFTRSSLGLRHECWLGGFGISPSSIHLTGLLL